MKLKVREVAGGLHPNEVVVAVETADGTERLVVDRRSLAGGYLPIGYPIDVQGDEYLVELPRETAQGSWRVWVGRDSVIEKEGLTL